MRCISAVHWKEIQNVENLTTKLQNIFAISFSNGYILLHLLFFLINCILKKIAHHRKASIFKVDHQENKGNQTNKAKKNKNKVSWLTCSPFYCIFHVTIVTITKKRTPCPNPFLKESELSCNLLSRSKTAIRSSPCSALLLPVIFRLFLLVFLDFLVKFD